MFFPAAENPTNNAALTPPDARMCFGQATRAGTRTSGGLQSYLTLSVSDRKGPEGVISTFARYGFLGCQDAAATHVQL